ncbi:MAG TPA: hypothetical protein VGK59_10005 [Ohtaekwangia sp.]
MTKAALIKFIVLFLFATTVYGQKVKYKDIFGLLNTKQYEAAEPFLKKYLKENDDNPNAFLFMGITFQEKAAKEDILRRTARTISFMDSAIYFYDKAYKTITEKEIKRNDEYYQAYSRRDLRTGDFGVKLSDIQFDLEKRMEGLRERIDRVKMVKHYFTLADTLYKRSAILYKSLQDSFPSEKALFLRANENTTKKLAALTQRFDSCTKAFDHYKASLTTVGKTGYNQALTLKEIQDFKTEGTSPADFYQDDLKIWDYKRFADKSRQTIEKEIFPMREHLVSYDIEINKLREKLNQDSVSVRNDLTKLIDKLLMEQLKKFDSEPLPMEVFTLKIADLEYRSVALEGKKINDSTDIHAGLAQVKQQEYFIKRLDSISSKMLAEDIERKAEDYQHFITNTYSNTIVLKSYVKALKEFAERQQRDITAQLAARERALQWLSIPPDSVPLNVAETSSRFKPLLVTPEKFTTGLAYTDSLSASGYFYTITPSRSPDVKVSFDVDKASFKQARLPYSKSIVFSDAAGQIFYVLIYSERAGKDAKYPATVAKIYRSDGLAWNVNYGLSFVPKELSFKQDTGELLIKADAMQTVIDKNGKLLR